MGADGLGQVAIGFVFYKASQDISQFTHFQL